MQRALAGTAAGVVLATVLLVGATPASADSVSTGSSRPLHFFSDEGFLDDIIDNITITV
ncbi:hypothetical protein MRI28_05030 [Nocardiopsis dassonvillei]|uniref:hypothetical protein n=1 Tax=Nocardiopsis dassonvillei TaxID=2014 RepID=UPI0020107C78|nr:hypothetical protein [Nocardiopsis dassonvillei]MCK9869020.1 hypothetical protein [Nocardiopsis dassonvillei]